MLRNIVSFYGEALLARRPKPKLEDHPLSAVRECVFNIQADPRISEVRIRGFSYSRFTAARKKKLKN